MKLTTRTATALSAAALFAATAAVAPSILRAQGMAGGMAETPTTQPAGMASNKTIVEIAQSTGMHNTFVKAVQAAGLAEVLSSPGPFTVFAPTDAAFAKLPAGTLDSLMKPENKEKLADILKHHVVSGAVTSKQVMGMDEAKPLYGDPVMIESSDGTVMVGDAKVVKADVVAKNGIIHVIDAVLLP